MNRKRNVYIMYMIVFLQGLVFYGPVAVLYRQHRNLSLTDIFLIESISWILVIVFEVPWGWFADKFGYKKTLIIANVVFFLSKIVFFKANSFDMFFFERVLLSISIAGISGCDVALLYMSVDEKDSSKTFGAYNACSVIGYLLASVLSSFIVRISLDSTALFTIIPYGMAAVLSLFIIDVDIQYKEKTRFIDSLKQTLKNKNIIILVISAALINEVVQAVSVFLNQSQYVRSGIGIKYFGILAAVMQIVRLSSFKSHKLSSKLGEYRSIKLSYVAIAVCCIVLTFTSNAFFTIISIIVICASAAIVSPVVLAIENKCIATADRATILSMFSIFADLTAAGSNVIIGKATDISVSSAFIVCIVMCLSAYLLLIVYNKRNSKYKM